MDVARPDEQVSKDGMEMNKVAARLVTSRRARTLVLLELLFAGNTVSAILFGLV